MEADFSGYATKAGLKCSDGRTIMPNAFQEQNGNRVPLVWQHGHNDPGNVVGHAILEHRDGDVYCYGFFNETPAGKNAKVLVQHGDIDSLSIYANKLMERSKQVFHGIIREVSLVLSGANPGAKIDNVAIRHADDSVEYLDDEVVIYTGLPLEHDDLNQDDEDDSDDVEHGDDSTIAEIYESLSDEQKTVVHYMIGVALEGAVTHSDTDEDDDTTPNNGDEGDLEHTEGNNDMTRNVFEKDGQKDAGPSHTLSHSDLQEIMTSASRSGSLKAAMEDYALQHGIDDIDILFPEARTLTQTPEWNKRRTEWVAGVLSGVHKSPFSRIKTVSADITHDEARAKGYVKGSLKKEEFFGLLKRVTTPTTIYKKQKLDRDDVIDIVDLDVVSWMKGEMRLMLEEELACAILFGDGRDVDDEDKINEGNIRPIASEDELYATTINVEADIAAHAFVDKLTTNRHWYKGTGTPTFYTTEAFLNSLLIARDTLNRRIWRTAAELAEELRVDRIVTVEAMERETDLIGVIVNLQDYNVGADRGGEVSMFDDFDIDYNQLKYLIETRCSGALTKIKSALVLRQVSGSATMVVPTEPSFNSSTGVITIPTVTGVTYKRADTDATVSAGAMTALDEGASLGIYAVASSDSYYFETDAEDEWTFTRDV